MYVGGTAVAAAPPLVARRSEHDAGLLCSIHTMSKDIQYSSNAKKTEELCSLPSSAREKMVVLKQIQSAAVVMATLPQHLKHGHNMDSKVLLDYQKTTQSVVSRVLLED